ncbi:zinc-binding alcohol dehydrogenase family protein (plasmid) [Paroceanicella profunda]|uniref:Zinc-type alcohol dehydrogenase-like protein n=1 Tax=Paroceanicella profunda TaxID=2579971 RepID=A0A5B8G461_9RHOB|nr:zinc-binding alcohol dehydrogenase family protein [Paroceanicella profunda]QDL94229.1 zinc-binding alcohol dehydrogenase family protein [Paroceanicella profunda]
MKAVGYQKPGPITEEASLVDIDLPKPTATGRDLLVEVKAVSVNPIDYKIRRSTPPQDADWKVIGWDASGIVTEVGPEVTEFAVGDEVYYAGSLTRAGANSQFHLVDERIVGAKPKSLNWAEAAALPLTSITAWEALFDRLDVNRNVPGAARAIVIIGGAGGVGSIAVQIARRCTDLTVIATASRPETRDWVEGLGAHHVLDHSQPLAAQVEALGIGAPAFAFSTTHTDKHVGEIAAFIAPQGRFALIDDPKDLDIMQFKRKAVSIHHELMFTRPLFGTPDMDEQGKLLNAVSKMVDEGEIRTTLNEHWSPIDAANLKRAHTLLESGTAKGKVVLEGWQP